MNGDQLKSLQAVIEKHLPNSRIHVPSALEDPPRCFSQFHAQKIYEGRLGPAEPFGFTHEKNKLRDIAAKLRSLKEDYKALGLIGQGALEEGWAKARGRKWSADDEIRWRYHLSLLSEAADKALKREGLQRPANPRTNYLAASVAGECRLVWEMQTFLDTHGNDPARVFLELLGEHQKVVPVTSTTDAFLDHIANKVPKSAHNDRPGPMGLFIEDVFRVLDICQRNGAPVSAATALRRLERFRRQQNAS